ncbi:DJ-1 family glyoxalase III [Sodalis sp. CWE]|uniref:DJ-1 family glyoxalase III n=1 Tax=Sodalis sp. CWE TaxID=2803816 RepID=UPI001C7D41C5|nr:DJ-1 family glyoxalase III [Sodalis sp. CWE]MBX4181204.1 DJ-1/PfpI family protein [Sodalis sp. CWE]
MYKSALLCVANGTEEIEVVTIFDLLKRANIQVKMANVNGDDHTLMVICSYGLRLFSDARLVDLKEQFFDVIILPGGQRGSECFQRSSLLMEYINQMHLLGKLVAAICAAPVLVLQNYQIFKEAYMTSFPAFKNCIPKHRWIDQRVVYDAHYHLLTSQGPGTAIDFSLNIISLLCGKLKATEVASQLVLPKDVLNFDVCSTDNKEI